MSTARTFDALGQTSPYIFSVGVVDNIMQSFRQQEKLEEIGFFDKILVVYNTDIDGYRHSYRLIGRRLETDEESQKRIEEAEKEAKEKRYRQEQNKKDKAQAILERKKKQLKRLKQELGEQ